MSEDGVLAEYLRSMYTPGTFLYSASLVVLWQCLVFCFHLELDLFANLQFQQGQAQSPVCPVGSLPRPQVGVQRVDVF